jgi:hypothetical protein
MNISSCLAIFGEVLFLFLLLLLMLMITTVFLVVGDYFRIAEFIGFT